MADHQKTLVSSDHENDGKHHLLLAATGSVATIKIVNILRAFSHYTNLSIRLIFTQSAVNFLAGQSAEQPHVDSLRRLANVDGIHFDGDEWEPTWKREQSILHIECRRWADLLVIAPLSANGLAKITGGFCDNLLTSVVRAWDTTGEIDATRSVPGCQRNAGDVKKIIVAPSMNTAMWNQPITKKHIEVLETEWTWFEVLHPQEKALACGDVGGGAMKEWFEIVKIVENEFGLMDGGVEGEGGAGAGAEVEVNPTA